MFDMDEIIYISFATVGTPYVEEVKTLIASLKKYELKKHIVELPNRGNWLMNCNMKAGYSLYVLEQYKRPIVWLDADAEVCQYPELFYTLDEYDIAFHRFKGQELLSGTLFLNYTDWTLDIVRQWMKRNDKHIFTPDQLNLDKVLEMNEGGNIYALPPTYCQIFDLMEGSGDPVILHHQASRRFKKGINNG